MTFTNQQVRKLRSKLKPQHIKARETEGQTLHYLEGWHVVAEANRIFGFDAWDRETVSNTCVWTKQVGARYCAAYVARVRITVRAGDATITREGCGSGESNEATPGQAHDRASKAAETDATKRALTTFGNCFGLTLYAGALSQPQNHRPERNGAFHSANGLRSASNGNASEHQVPASIHQAPAISQNANAHAAGDNGSAEHAGAIHSAEKLTTDVEHAAAHLGLREIGDPGTGRGIDRAFYDSPGIDKSVLAIAEPRRVRDPAHLKYVAEQPCIICGRQPCEAHHLRYSQPRALGRKSSDAYTVPLCALHHRELHTQGNERAWWIGRGRDPMPVADELWRNSRGEGRSI